jgi:hypothetical protein
MPEPNAPVPHEDDDAALEAGEDLQFEEAEFETPPAAGPSCDACKRPIPDEYYEINGKVLCASCRQQIEAAIRGGSRMARALKALALGSVGAVAGAVLYYAIVRITGGNWGLVAVVVGFMVGGAVRKGSGNRGGLFYQFLALFLTYSAIVAMHVTMLIEHFTTEPEAKGPQANIAPEKVAKEHARNDGEPKPAIIASKEAANPKADLAPSPLAAAPKRDPVADLKQNPAPAEGQKQLAADALENPHQKHPAPSLTRLLLLIVFLTGWLFAIPIQVAISAPISGLIYAFALWEAWKINKGAQLVFSGPFRVSTGVAATPAPEVLDDGG